MRRLTLILSDLYLPDESRGARLPQTYDLPSLDWLLRFAAVQTIDDWRSWLRRESGAQGAGLASMDNQWLATPVQLEARLDHVRLVDRGLLRVGREESSAWCEEFNRTFGPQYALRECGERAFQLSGLEPPSAPTVDPARLLGADIGPSLPGPQAAELRRLWAEIEMWLHASPLNVARERSHQPRISAFWIWGNEPAGVAGMSAARADLHWYGSDPLMRELAIRSGAFEVIDRLAEVNTAFDHLFAEFAPLTGGTWESFPALEEHWFAPARAELGWGRLEFVQVVANDRVFTVRPRAGWKFWRRRRGWLESLA